jgi:hypothetical protein
VPPIAQMSTMSDDRTTGWKAERRRRGNVSSLAEQRFGLLTDRIAESRREVQPVPWNGRR